MTGGFTVTGICENGTKNPAPCAVSRPGRTCTDTTKGIYTH
ncbi:MAG: hypothetical protein ACLRRG_03630 [Barnesiella sp.]